MGRTTLAVWNGLPEPQADPVLLNGDRWRIHARKSSSFSAWTIYAVRFLVLVTGLLVRSQACGDI
jgi:hypothetical protein